MWIYLGWLSTSNRFRRLDINARINGYRFERIPTEGNFKGICRVHRLVQHSSDCWGRFCAFYLISEIQNHTLKRFGIGRIRIHKSEKWSHWNSLFRIYEWMRIFSHCIDLCQKMASIFQWNLEFQPAHVFWDEKNSTNDCNSSGKKLFQCWNENLSQKID